MILDDPPVDGTEVRGRSRRGALEDVGSALEVEAALSSEAREGVNHTDQPPPALFAYFKFDNAYASVKF